jgi:hypothetical protein
MIFQGVWWIHLTGKPTVREKLKITFGHISSPPLLFQAVSAVPTPDSGQRLTKIAFFLAKSDHLHYFRTFCQSFSLFFVTVHCQSFV